VIIVPRKFQENAGHTRVKKGHLIKYAKGECIGKGGGSKAATGPNQGEKPLRKREGGKRDISPMERLHPGPPIKRKKKRRKYGSNGRSSLKLELRLRGRK